MKLRHLQLPHRAAPWPPLYPPYSLASRVQEHLRRRLLDSKDAAAAAVSSATTTTTTDPDPDPDPDTQQQQPPLGVTATGRPSPSPSPPPPPPPLPTLLSFTPLPTYTLGRRQSAPLSAQEEARLRAPLQMMSPPDNNSQKSLPVSVVHSPRGGLVTYHGPGQTVLWPVLDLRSASYRQFTVRCYSRLLEDTTIAVLQRAMGLVAFTTDDPGVWVQSQAARNPAKIAALGVHLRRHVSALGTAVNVAMPRSGSGSSSTEVFSSSSSEEKTNPWARIVACGLEGRIVTSAAAEVDGGLAGLDRLLFQAREGGGEEEQMNREDVVAALWAGELAGRIGVDGVETVGREEVVGLLGDVLDGVDGDDDVSAEEWEYVRALRDGV